MPTAVYLFWDADGNSLYVGLTVSVKTRHGEHAREKDWWHEVAHIDLVDCASWDRANAQETRMIEFLNPRYNIRKKPKAA